MKNLIFLLSLCCFVTAQSQTVTGISVILESEAINSAVDSSILVATQPRSGDGTIAEFSLDGKTLLQQETLPNDNPSFATVIPKEITAKDGHAFITAETFADNSGGNLNRAQSLFKIPSDLKITSETPRLVAYNSLFSGLYTNGKFTYVLYTAFQRTATLSINNFNGTAPSIIPDLGRDRIIRMWLLKIDINDVTNILEITPFGDPSTNTFPAFNSNDDQGLLYKDMYELDNGNIVIEYMDDVINRGDNYLAIIDPVDHSVVHSFGPFLIDEDLFITDFDGGYALAHYKAQRIELLDTDFNVINEIKDFGVRRRPGKMQQFGKYLKVAGSDGLSGSETNYIFYYGERLIEAHKRGGVASRIDFKNYFESFFAGETTTINVGSYGGEPVELGGVTLPQTDRRVYHLVVYVTDESGPEDTINVTDASSDFIAVYQNTKLDPDNNSQLISGAHNETWATLAPGTIIPEDGGAIPTEWLQGVVIPDGFKLEFNQFVFMDSDRFSQEGYNRYFTLRVIPQVSTQTAGRSTLSGDTMRVWVTHNVFTPPILSVDAVTANDFSVYPNPTNGIINIKGSKTIETIDVYSMAGQQIARYSNLSQIDLSSVAAGLYMLRISSGDGAMSTMKIVKQ